MEDTLTLVEELERKTLDAVARVMTDHEDGAISQPTAIYALQMLFAASSGLVGGETFDLVSQASKELSAQPKRDHVRRFFVHTSKQLILLLQYQYGEAEIVIKKGPYPHKPSDVNLWQTVKTATFETNPNPFQAAQSRFVAYANELRRQGFQEIQ